MLNELASLRLKDLEIFLEVSRAKSIREVARRASSTSGQVSKSVQNLERRLGAKLFKRSAAGVLLTSQGAELQALVQELLETGEKIEGLVSGKNKQKFEKVFAIAGSAFLTNHFISPFVCQSTQKLENVTFRFLDLNPEQIVGVGLRGAFEMAVHISELSWPSTWTTKTLGKTKWSLCARADHPLPKRPSLKQILEYPFVTPTYWTSEGVTRGTDQFPIPLSKRKKGHETATADAAVPILLNSDQIAFMPELLIETFLQTEQLRLIRTDEVPVVEKSVYLTVKSDAVPSHLFQSLIDGMSKALK